MTQNSNGYNPHDHLITIRAKDGSQKPYLPAAWRLYELTLRYPNANFSSEIMLLDVDRNLVVVKCRLYLGASYEQSDKKTEAMKSGPLSSLDKVETAAKARCARDFGVSTELALDITDLEEEDSPTTPPQARHSGKSNGTPSNSPGEYQAPPASPQGHSGANNIAPLIARAKERAKALGMATNIAEWYSFVQECLREKGLRDADITLDRIARINGRLTAIEKERKATA